MACGDHRHAGPPWAPQAQGVTSRRGVRALAATLLAAALLLCLHGPTQAQRGDGPLFRREARLGLEQPAVAVAVNADESILAAAQPAETAGAWRITFLDRPSRAPLGHLEARVGPNPRLQFAPAADLLLVYGDAGLAVWEIPIAPLKPGEPLPDRYQRWAVRLDASATLGTATFDPAAQRVIWTQGGRFHARSVAADRGAGDAPAGPAAGPAVQALAFAPDGTLLVARKGEKALQAVHPQRFEAVGSLAGHRFPAGAVLARGGNTPALSVDAGGNLARWAPDLRMERVTHLEGLPEGVAPGALLPLGDRHALLAGPGGAVAVDTEAARVAARLPGGAAGAVGVSPTGRYVLAARGRTLTLYGFAAPQSPLSYVRALRERGADALAQSYVRLMDDSGVSEAMQADLLAEATRASPEEQLQDALARLRVAQEEGETERIRHWAEAVLALEPGHPAAQGALQALRLREESQVLARAREALDAGEPRAAISLLTGRIGQASRLYPQARELIREAEQARAVQSTLEQARQKLSLGDYTAARALVNEVLRGQAEHPEALALREEIEARSGESAQRLLAPLLGILLGIALAGLVAWRYRERLHRFFHPLTMEEHGPLRAGGRPGEGLHAAAGNGAVGRQAGAHGAGQAGAQTGPRHGRAGAEAPPARRKVVEDLLERAEALLANARQSDLYRRYTALLMELEAELQSIQRRLGDSAGELGPLHNRLKDIVGRLRELGAQRETATGGTRARAGRQDAAGGASTRHESAGTAHEEALTHYEVLEVTPEASAEDIRNAYHRLLKQYHPDLHNASEFDWVKAEADRMSRRISEAYQVLSDAHTRQRYDETLRRRGRRGS